MFTVSSAGASPPPKFSNEKPSRSGVYRSDAPTAVAWATTVVVGAGSGSAEVLLGATVAVVVGGAGVVVTVSGGAAGSGVDPEHEATRSTAAAATNSRRVDDACGADTRTGERCRQR